MRRFLASLIVLAFVAPIGARAATPESCRTGLATVSLQASTVALANGCIIRVWDRVGVQSYTFDFRSSLRTQPAPDFTLDLDGVSVPSSLLTVASVSASGDHTEHATVTWHLLLPGTAEVVRTVEIYAGVAAFAARTTISSLAPLALSGYTLDQLSVGPTASATIEAFRAGSDWRAPDWNPPSIGDPHTGDVRLETTGAQGQTLKGNAEWISTSFPGGEHVGIVSERRDYASSVASFDGTTQSVGVDFSRDVIYLGPFEEDVHAENPGPGPARHRVVIPGRPFDLEPAYTFFGTDADDEAWQFSKYMTEHRAPHYRKGVIFNSDGVDQNAVSTGAKDDMNYARLLQILPAVKQMGFDTFVFDDGWMAASGDWCPDSAACPEPRAAAHPTWGPRFPDDHFGAVKARLDEAGLKLGLWMNPMEFNPASKAFTTNPQWACAPVGDGTAAVNVAQPDSSSNEAGIGVWNPMALGLDPDTSQPERLIDHIEGRLRRMIDVYGASFFKFDFLAFSDCAGVEPVDMYAYHDAFVQMLDRVLKDHSDVTFEVDDTNDYRMFPFETIARGPSWYQNGGPSFAEQMHNVWKLAPFVPGYAIGQRMLAQRKLGIDTMMSAAINSHLTFSQPVDTNFTNDERNEVAKWTAFYKENRDTLATFSYPLLEDPTADSWTAMQPWNGDTHSGWLLAYRQGSEDAKRVIPLRGLGSVDGNQSFQLTQFDPATGAVTDLGTRSANELRTLGQPVGIDQPNGYAIIRVTPA